MDRPDAANPFGDFTKMLEQFKLPGFDVPAIMEARRKDMEALVQANQTAFQGMQSLAQKQALTAGSPQVTKAENDCR